MFCESIVIYVGDHVLSALAAGRTTGTCFTFVNMQLALIPPTKSCDHHTMSRGAGVGAARSIDKLRTTSVRRCRRPFVGGFHDIVVKCRRLLGITANPDEYIFDRARIVAHIYWEPARTMSNRSSRSTGGVAYRSDEQIQCWRRRDDSIDQPLRQAVTGHLPQPRTLSSPENYHR